MDLEYFLEEQKRFSARAFGDGARTEGICRHIELELEEIRKNPTDVMEWIDVVILAFDGALRAGHAPKYIQEALQTKFNVNLNRSWPSPGGQDRPKVI